jgi:hypothetical protein
MLMLINAKSIFEAQSVKMLSGLNWIRTGSSGGLL